MRMGDLQNISMLAGKDFVKYREHKESYYMTQDKNLRGNFVHITNETYAATIRLNFSDGTLAPAIIEKMESMHNLDFNYYYEVIDKANAIYQQNSFFNESLKIPFEGDTWNQFMPSKRKKRLYENFSRNIKIVHTSYGCRDSRMVLKHKLAIANIQLPSGIHTYVPVLKFTLPISRITNKTIIMSASPKYEFMFCLEHSEMIPIERNEVDQFMSKLNKSIVTHMYNSLKKNIGMDDILLKDFKKFDDEERERFLMVSNMLKV